MIKNIIFKVEDVPKLQTLRIEDNKLTQLPKFHGVFPSLQELYLTRNYILHVCEDGFKNITNINFVDLSSNGLLSFESRQELTSLSDLRLNNNSLSETPSLNGSQQSLTSLFLGGNDNFAENLPAVTNYLEQFPNLNKIGLSDLRIRAPINMSNVLTELDLSANNITEIHDDFFKNTEVQFTLFLDNNPLEILPNLYKYTMVSDANECRCKFLSYEN